MTNWEIRAISQAFNVSLRQLFRYHDGDLKKLSEDMKTFAFRELYVNRHATFLPELNLELFGLNGVYNRDSKSMHRFSILQQLNLIADKDIREGPINTQACPDHDFPLIKFDHPFAYFVLDEHESPVFAGVYYGDNK